jgi:hypothetical protein
MSDTDVDNPGSLERENGGYSLASLALVVTVCVVFLASIDIHRCRELLAREWTSNSEDLIVGFAVAAVLGGIIGFVWLIFTPFSWRKLVLAPVCGGATGAAAVLVFIAPAPIWQMLMAIVLLLATTNLLRLGFD